MTEVARRAIGRHAEGYEASFLAFAGDPLADFEATRRIALRVKDGRILDLGPPPPRPVARGGLGIQAQSFSTILPTNALEAMYASAAS
jgi:hypothetical protein